MTNVQVRISGRAAARLPRCTCGNLAHALMGANGADKTTLLRTIIDQLAAGRRRVFTRAAGASLEPSASGTPQ
jgi:ABC-type Mn2+/Zn2+ transport system ATPase subunit